MSEWRTIRAADFIDFNPRLNLKKGAITTKVAMDKLKPFTKKFQRQKKPSLTAALSFATGIPLWQESRHALKTENRLC